MDNTPGTSSSTDTKNNANRDSVTPLGRDLRTDAHQAIDKAAGQVTPAAARLAEQAHGGVDQVADTLGQASASLAERGKQLSATYKQFAETGRGYVRSSPAIAVLLAAAAGYGLSKLLGTRSK